MRTESNINRSFSVISTNKHSNIYTITSGLSFSKKKKKKGLSLVGKINIIFVKATFKLHNAIEEVPFDRF